MQKLDGGDDVHVAVNPPLARVLDVKNRSTAIEPTTVLSAPAVMNLLLG